MRKIHFIFIFYFLHTISGFSQTQFQAAIGGTANDQGNSIIQTSDGGYCACCYTNSFGAGLYDSYIVKLDANGSIQWNKTIGGAGDDIANCLIQTSDGGYAVSGSTT